MAGDWTESQSPGWNAINEALYPVYGGTEPMHWGTLVSWRLGGPDPIHGISAYRNNRLRNHLHFITYGFSELWEKEGDDPKISGFGFELTFRLACGPDEKPPVWPLNFLQNLGRYVFSTGRSFGAGHSMSLNGPIALDQATRIGAITFAIDPELPAIDTPNGHVTFLQIVGLTEDELSAIEAWDGSRFLDLVIEQNELLITDLGRDSYLADPNFAARVRALTETEGASAEAVWCNRASFECSGGTSCHLTFGATVAIDLAHRLPGRIPHGRPFAVLTDDLAIVLEPGARFSWEEATDGLRVALTAEQCKIFIAELLKPRAGTYSSHSLPGLTVRIEKTVIKDDEGNVVRVVG